jgi:ABC-2 type transport system ATP-binding protein
MIEVKSLSKNYGSHLAVQDISFRAEAGEILGFLGPNGAGKTTTMRILTGYMPPTSGSARVAGFDVVQESLDVRKRVGYLPETVPLYPEMSVVEYLRFMGSLRKVKELEERILDVLEEVNLEDRSESFIGNLSKGLRQRVGLAQALLHQPEVLILDEPTIGLDPAQIIEVRKLIQDLREDRTVLLSTHILSEAQQVCDRVLIIHNGHIMAEDSPSNLQNQLAGGVRIYVQAVATTEDLQASLEKLKDVSAVLPGDEEGSVLLTAVPGKDLRPHVAKQVIKSGIELLELRQMDISLEQIFLQLTKDDVAENR